jgi:hypothetical protein
MPSEKAQWKKVRLSYPCVVCNASPGEPCYTSTGNPKSEVHAERGRDVDRCPKCGTRLPADYDPGELCDRCKQVRALEIERAQYHIRRH